ncbi:MAG: hypothetical protein Q9172_005973 [Xanthocarpia lactea]
MATSGSRPRPTSNLPVIANFDSTHLTIGAGVAIFHLATSRVVICYHSEHKYWFLPKGRRDAGEDSGTGAEREGFEEVCISQNPMNTLTLPQSGYRNRLLPIPLRHRQPQAHNSDSAMSSFVTEPVWTQLMPVTRSAQYMLFWYIAETLPPEIDHSLSQKSIQANNVYMVPPAYPEATWVNEEEALYESYLLSINDAQQKLSGTIMADVVRIGWEAIQALGLAITTVMGLFTYTILINDGPAKALQAYVTLGLQHHPVGLPTSESHITELSHNSSTVAFSFAPARTCDSYLHLPAHEQGVNATLPTAHVEQARNLRPQSPLSEQLRVAPLPHGLSNSINVLTMKLPIGIDLCLGFFSLGLVILIYIIWRNCHVAVEGRARSERQIGSFWVSFVTALASNADANARLRSLEALHKEVLDHYVCSKMPTASNPISILDTIMDDLKRHHAKIDLGEIMLPEDESYRKILSLETTVSEITNGRDEVMGKYEALEKKHQEALSGADTLRKTSQGLASDNELLQQVNRELSDKNSDLEHQKHNLDSALVASKTECGQVTANLTECKSQNRDLESTFRAMKSRRDEAVEELDRVSEDREAITRAKETYRMRTERGEEALASSQEEVKRVVAENSRLKTVNRDAKLHQKQEKEAINEQLAKATKELQDLRAQSKDHQPLSSATKKILESENATVRSDLKQAEQVKKDLLEANEGIADKVRTMEEQLKHAREREQAAQAKATRLEDEAFDRETARMDEDSASRALVIKEQQKIWETDYDESVAALERKWQGKVDALVSEKSTTEMELMKAKEEVDALAKQVTDQLTANPPSSQDAQGMRPSSHLLALAATFPTDANNPSAPFNTSSNHSVQEELRALQKEFSTRTNLYETRIDGLNTAIGQLTHERSMLQSRLAAMGPHPPSGLHMPGVYHHRPGGPVIPPLPITGNLGVPPFTSGGGSHGLNTDAHPHGNGGPLMPMIPPGGPREFQSFNPGRVNLGFSAHSQADRGPVMPPFAGTGQQGAPFNPGAVPFNPAGSH